jgi:hypothetical protein
MDHITPKYGITTQYTHGEMLHKFATTKKYSLFLFIRQNTRKDLGSASYMSISFF